MVLHKNKYEDQWNRIEDPDMNHTATPALILTKTSKLYAGEKTASSTNITGKTGYLPAET
jgi:hypothetical protein